MLSHQCITLMITHEIQVNRTIKAFAHVTDAQRLKFRRDRRETSDDLRRNVEQFAERRETNGHSVHLLGRLAEALRALLHGGADEERPVGRARRVRQDLRAGRLAAVLDNQTIRRQAAV